MKRREFIHHSSAGLLFSWLAPQQWKCDQRWSNSKKIRFKPYRSGRTLGKVYQVTPDDGFFANTYYDICPFSPSQRYLALTKFPYQDRITKLGDVAEVVIIDLQEQSMQTVYQTKVWGYQLGANLHWGISDRFLYTNDLLNGHFACCIQIDLITGETKAFDGPVYDLDAGGGTAIGPHLEFMNNSQYAYATPSPDPALLEFQKLADGAAESDGLWHTSLDTAKTKLLLPLSNVVPFIEGHERDQGAAYYFFHTKYSPQADAIMLVVRYPVLKSIQNGTPKYQRNPTLLICDRHGENIRQLISRDQWRMGGHHPNWHPNNYQIVMNLNPKWLGVNELRFCAIDVRDGNVSLLAEQIMGSGHPSIDRTGRYLISDCYPFEPMASGNGEIPIRLIDLNGQEEETICTMYTDLGSKYKMARYWGPSKLDAHPVWSRDGKKVCFNGAPNGTRQVFVADLKDVI